ncbi:hypothetical protein NDU88_001801 [Pleurodeles waltl]|uniref:Uncharacterized protein n=1 Tax=Pleurodeles waltl TaxID=8319 RepID=A0AAV7Q4R0_PLEWA|nr:hypothetical protein NDU88_001801 [Pleurodeles waltl]
MTEGPADEVCLKGLADAIKLLYDIDAREWTADDVISLLDELSECYNPPKHFRSTTAFGSGAAFAPTRQNTTAGVKCLCIAHTEEETHQHTDAGGADYIEEHDDVDQVSVHYAGAVPEYIYYIMEDDPSP